MYAISNAYAGLATKEVNHDGRNKMDPNCGFGYGNDGTPCVTPPTGYNNWIMGNWFFSYGVDILIALVVIAGAWWLIWYFSVYRRRPFCIDCQNENTRTRTTLYYSTNDLDSDVPVCSDHYNERLMNAETTYTCSAHGIMCDKRWDRGQILHFCPEGCVFAPNNRYSRVISHAKRNSGSSVFAGLWVVWWSIGFTTGMALGRSQGPY